MDDLMLDSLKFARETSTQLLSLATGIITLSVAFAKSILPAKTPRAVTLLALSWLAFLVSVLFGIAVLLATTGNAAIHAGGGPADLSRSVAEGGGDTNEQPSPPGRTLSPYESNVVGPFAGQLGAFGLATVFLVAFGVHEVRRLPDPHLSAPHE